ncbi:hypothetical protein BJF88_08175 [Cellulosimicrobium sp. CUA-896]|nr:hypothetical protein BJF88_08175 [Cellulosimicrobium sp. CUA-896]
MDSDTGRDTSASAADSVEHVVVMGVAGSGKTTVATLLADRLGITYAEADQFHPQANIDKMTAGTALTDEDRWPWLEAIRDWLTSEAEAGRSGVVTCSALKRSYRDLLRAPAARCASCTCRDRPSCSPSACSTAAVTSCRRRSCRPSSPRSSRSPTTSAA